MDNEQINEQTEGTEEVKQAEKPQEKPQEEEKKYTDAELDEIINKKFAKWKEKEEKKVKEAQAEAEKLAQMDLEEKHKYQLEQLTQENEELKKLSKRIEMSKEATKLLKEKKIEATEDILDFVVTDEAESTKANIDKLSSIIQNQVKLVDAERATGKTPQRYSHENEQVTEFEKHLAKYKK